MKIIRNYIIMQSLSESISHSGNRSRIEFFYKENGQDIGYAEGGTYHYSFLSSDENDVLEKEFSHIFHTDRNDILSIHDVQVDPGHRGKGIATQLIQAIEHFASQNHFKYIMLRAQPQGSDRMTLRELVSFYERRGFETLVDNDFPKSIVMGKEA